MTLPDAKDETVVVPATEFALITVMVLPRRFAAVGNVIVMFPPIAVTGDVDTIDSFVRVKLAATEITHIVPPISCQREPSCIHAVLFTVSAINGEAPAKAVGMPVGAPGQFAK